MVVFYTFDRPNFNNKLNHNYFNHIDRGNFSGKVWKLLWDLQTSYPETIFLKGNHEYIYKFHCRNVEQTDWATIGAGRATIVDFEKEGITQSYAIDFFDSLSLEYDVVGFKVSYAGVAITETNIYDEDNYEFGILWTRNELKNIGKPQFIGHTPHDLQIPLFIQNSDTYNIDGDCCYGRGLTGIIVNEKGELMENYFIKVDSRDIDF